MRRYYQTYHQYAPQPPMGHRLRYNPGSYNNGGNYNYNYNRTDWQSSQFDNYPQQNRRQQQRTHDAYPNSINRYDRWAQQPQQYLPEANQFTTVMSLFNTANPASSSNPNTRSERRRFRNFRHNRDRHSPSSLPPAAVTQVEGVRGDRPPPTTPTISSHSDKGPGSALSSSSPVSSDRKRAKMMSSNDLSDAPSVSHKIETPRAALGAKRPMSRYWDPYCWVCHSVDLKSSKIGVGNANSATMLNCSNCPRSFHEQCRISTKYQASAASKAPKQYSTSKSPPPFVCPECQITNQGGRSNRYLTQTKPEITPERFKRFFEFTMRRARLLMLSKKTIGIPPFFPSDADLIVNPLDLNAIEQNIRRLKYTSTDSFMADIRWLFHNASIVYSPSNSGSINSAGSSSSVANVHGSAILATLKKVENACWEEVCEMNTCPECYLNSYARDDWFAVVCSPVHILVWAKVKGFCYWPGKALRIRQATASHLESSSSNTDPNMVDVRFFGKHDKAWVSITNCFLLSENPPSNTSAPNRSTRRNQGYEQSMEELAIHLSNIQSLYDCPFPYALDDTPFSTLFTSVDHFTTSNNPLNHLHALLVAGVNQSISTKNDSHDKLPHHTPAPTDNVGNNKFHDMLKTAYVSIKRTHCARDVEPMCFTKSKDPPILPLSNSLRVKTEFCHKNSDELIDRASVTSAKSPPSSTGFQVELITSAKAENLAVTLEPQVTPPSSPEITAESASRECPANIVSQTSSRSETLSSIFEQSAPLAPSRSVKAEYQPPPPLATSLTALECAPPNDIVLPQSNGKRGEEQTNEKLPDYSESDNSINMCDSPSVVFVTQIKDTIDYDHSNEGLFASRTDQLLKSLRQAHKDFPLSTIGALSRAIAYSSGSSSISSDHSNQEEDHKLATTIQVEKAPKEVKNQPLSVPVKNYLKREPSPESNQPPLKSLFSNTSNLITSVPVSVALTSEHEDVKPHITLFALSSTQSPPKPSAESNPPPSKSSPYNTNNLNLSVPVSVILTSEPEDAKPSNLILCNTSTSTQSAAKPVLNESNQSFPPVTAPKLEPGLVQVTGCHETSAASTCFTTSSTMLPISYVPLVNIQHPTSCAHEGIPHFNTNTYVSTTLSPLLSDIAVMSVAPTAPVTIDTLTSTIVTIKQEPTVLTTIVELNTCNSVDRHSTPSPNITRGKEKSLTNTEAQSIKLGLNRALSIFSSGSLSISNSNSAINVSQLCTLASEPTKFFLPSTPSSIVGACQNAVPSLTQPISISTDQGIPDSTRQSPLIDNSALMASQITGSILNKILGPTPEITSAIDACGDTPPPTTAIVVTLHYSTPYASTSTITSPQSPQNNELNNSIPSGLTNLAFTPLTNPMACDLLSMPSPLSTLLTASPSTVWSTVINSSSSPKASTRPINCLDTLNSSLLTDRPCPSAIPPLLNSPSMIVSEKGLTPSTAATSPHLTLPMYPAQRNEGEFDTSPFITQVVEIMKDMTRQLQNHATTAVLHLKTLPVAKPPHVVETRANGEIKDVISLKEHHHHLMVLWQNAKAFYAKKLESVQKSYQMSYNQIERSNLLCTEKLAQRETRMKELENHFNNEIQSHKNELSQCYGTINKLQNEMKVEREQTQKAIDEIKRKQWCVACLKEAVYYCCVGIWYCDKPCQIAHWEVHKDVCEEMKRKSAETNSPKRASDNFNGHIQARQPNYLTAIPSFQQPMNNGIFVNQLPASSYNTANHCSNDATASMYYPFVSSNGLPNMSYQMRRDLPRPPPNCEPLERFKHFNPTSQQRH